MDTVWHRQMNLIVIILQFGGSNDFDQICSKKISKPFLWSVIDSVWKVFIKFHWHGQNTTVAVLSGNEKSVELLLTNFDFKARNKYGINALLRLCKSLVDTIKLLVFSCNITDFSICVFQIQQDIDHDWFFPTLH